MGLPFRSDEGEGSGREHKVYYNSRAAKDDDHPMRVSEEHEALARATRGGSLDDAVEGALANDNF